MHYVKHFLVCHNQKAEGRRCCGRVFGDEALAYVRAALKASELPLCRADAVACLGRCGLGPCLVVYPEGRWYTYNSLEILEAVVQGELNNTPYEAALLPKTLPASV